MPPKKRKGAGVQEDGVSDQDMWLLTYRCGGKSRDLEEGYAVFSSKEKAIAGLKSLWINAGRSLVVTGKME
jgi:hypothetical protein